MCNKFSKKIDLHSILLHPVSGFGRLFMYPDLTSMNAKISFQSVFLCKCHMAENIRKTSMNIVEIKTSTKQAHCVKLYNWLCFIQLKFHRIRFTSLKIVENLCAWMEWGRKKLHKSSIVFSSIELIACKAINCNI